MKWHPISAVFSKMKFQIEIDAPLINQHEENTYLGRQTSWSSIHVFSSWSSRLFLLWKLILAPSANTNNLSKTATRTQKFKIDSQLVEIQFFLKNLL